MADDPMSKFKAHFAPPKPAPALVVNRPDGKQPYVAHKHKDKVNRLDVRCKNGLEYSIAYTFIIMVNSNWRDQDEILVIGGGLLISIKGRALRLVAKAIKDGTCEYIQEFSEQDFVAPEDVNAAYIQSITVEPKNAIAEAEAA